MSCKLLSYPAARDARADVLVGDTVFNAAGEAGVATNASVLGMSIGGTKALLT